jgi:hypothetical protein
MDFHDERKTPHVDRFWRIPDSTLESRLERLYKRPRIDYRVSEYVVEYVNKNILEPRRISILKYGRYALSISLSFILFDRDTKETNDHNPMHPELSEYNTENTLYWSDYTRDGWELRRGYKTIYLYCLSTEINENIKPKEYADIVYDMVGAFLERKAYKRLSKEIMEKYRSEMNYEYIESFKYPAAFKDQKYYTDNMDSVRTKFFYNGYEGINSKEDYMRHYGEKMEDKTYEDEKLGTFIVNDYPSYKIDNYKLKENIISIIVYVETISDLKDCLGYLYKIIDNINKLDEISIKIFLETFKLSEDGLSEIKVTEIGYEKNKRFSLLYALPKRTREEVGTKCIKVFFDENNVAIKAVPGNW